MRIMIIGTGSIGSLFGSKLALAGHEIIPYSSQIVSKVHHNHTITLEESDGTIQKIEDFYLVPPLATYFSCSTEDLPPVVIIATKAYDLSKICRDYKQLLTRIPIIVLLQNGLGNERIVQRNFPDSTLYRLLTSHGASLDEFGVVHHTGQGPTMLCDMTLEHNKSRSQRFNLTQTFLTALSEAGFDPMLFTDPEEAIWRKALVNIGINAIGALTRVTNGSLMHILDLKKLVSQTVIEAYNLARMMQIPLLDQESYLTSVFSVINATQDNKNSMLQDILKGNRTEIDFLNGKIVELGMEIDIPTPINSMLTHLIKGLEKREKST
ncbi:MAG: ketopantoate reductase family protein [Promethearchaeota archaeon]